MSEYITKPIDKEAMLKIMNLYINHTSNRVKDTGRVAAPVAILCKIPGLDVIGALDRMGGNISLYLDILEAFADIQAGSAALIGKALHDGNLILAERTLHTFRGNADTIGAVILRDIALLLENTIRQDEPLYKAHRILEFLTHEQEDFMRVLLQELPSAQASLLHQP